MTQRKQIRHTALSMAAAIAFGVTLLYAAPLHAGIFNFKINGKEVDIGEFFGVKKKDDKEKGSDSSSDSTKPAKPGKKKEVSKKKQAAASSPVPAKPASPDEIEDTFIFGAGSKGAATEIAKNKTGSGKASATEAPQGGTMPPGNVPAIKGLRIGMRVDEVRDIINKWDPRFHLWSKRIEGGADHRNFRADSETPHHFRSVVNKRGQGKLLVEGKFTPSFPGDERLMSVKLEKGFSQRQRPSVADFEKAVQAQFGTPSYRGTQGKIRHYWWIYDISGELINGFSIDEDKLRQCGAQLYDSSLQQTRAVALPKKIVDLRSGCGSYTLHVKAYSESALVTIYVAVLHGNEEYIHSSITTKRKINDLINRRLNGT